MRKVLVYNGGAVALEPFPEASVGEGVNYIHQAAPVADNAQIKAFQSSGFQLIAAPGSNLIAVPVHVCAILNNTVAYSANQAGIVIRYAAGPQISATTTIYSGLQATGLSFIPFILSAEPVVGSGETTGLTVANVFQGADVRDSAVMVQDQWATGGDYTLGDAANSCTFFVQYLVWDTLTRQLVAA